jgi:hypothetical protein
MMRGEAKVTLSQAYPISLPCDTMLSTCIVSSMGAFSAMDGKIEQRVCIWFCLKLCKSAVETHEMLHDAFGEHSLS